MAQFLEVLQFRAPSGTVTALERMARAEGKRPSDLVREILLARISGAAVRDEAA